MAGRYLIIAVLFSQCHSFIPGLIIQKSVGIAHIYAMFSLGVVVII
jgi:hypothetical protein